MVNLGRYRRRALAGAAMASTGTILIDAVDPGGMLTFGEGLGAD